MTYSGEVLRGHTETIILAILRGGDSYGYEILKRILDAGGGMIDIRDATIYTAFKRMEKEGLITTYWGGEEAGGARRKYYSITDAGREYHERKAREWRELNVILNKLIGGDGE
ncbi:MAG: PadR family transcriptional regulator [Clostridia bacterium]|nr:PadR family transcriptional regulator [Clostridia bacterium]